MVIREMHPLPFQPRLYTCEHCMRYTQPISVTDTHLLRDWSFKLNSDSPFHITRGSRYKFWWTCTKEGCGYSWRALISDRVRGFGCPRCGGKVVTDENSLYSVRPDIASQWDYSKNGGIGPSEVFCFSHKKAWWLCDLCGTSWRSQISNRTASNGKCPVCFLAGKKFLRTEYPDIFSEISMDEPQETQDILSRSHKQLLWVCKLCSFEWKAVVKNRTLNGTGCPKCAKSSSISPVSQQWLDSLNIPAENREVWLEVAGKRLRVDGFDPKTNTVYEFLGDYWHGNPEVFEAEEINPVTKTTFGELYERTMDRLSILSMSGYQVIYKWGRRRGRSDCHNA